MVWDGHTVARRCIPRSGSLDALSFAAISLFHRVRFADALWSRACVHIGPRDRYNWWTWWCGMAIPLHAAAHLVLGRWMRYLLLPLACSIESASRVRCGAVPVSILVQEIVTIRGCGVKCWLFVYLPFPVLSLSFLSPYASCDKLFALMLAHTISLCSHLLSCTGIFFTEVSQVIGYCVFTTARGTSTAAGE